MKKRERKYHQNKMWAKKRPLIFLKKRRGGIDIGVHKDRANDLLNTQIHFTTPNPDYYDGIRMKRIWHDEFVLWDTGQEIKFKNKGQSY